MGKQINTPKVEIKGLLQECKDVVREARTIVLDMLDEDRKNSDKEALLELYKLLK